MRRRGDHTRRGRDLPPVSKRARRAAIAAVVVLAAACAVVVSVAWFAVPRISCLPPMHKVLNPQRFDVPVSYDISGRSVTDPGDAPPEDSPQRGDVRIDRALLELGRETFYRETFGNEVFLTDIMGILDGPLSPYRVAKAVLALGGRGTTNLRVELAETITIGDVTYRKGDVVDTGLDVPKGSFAILGMPVRVDGGRIRAGITCAACHSTVDATTGMVIEGAVNGDLAAGLLMALATNSAAYFPHAEVPFLVPFVRDRSRTVETSDGKRAPLPDREALEGAVDRVFASWPPGSFDSTIDLKADPTQIPDSFTLGDHPYGWSGFAAVGPLRGLSAFCNNVHAQNSDALAQADLAMPLFGIDKEVYLATILQNAADPKFRFDPAGGRKPSEFFALVDPTPRAPGVNHLIKPPGYPEISWIAPDGMFLASPGRNVWEQNNAMAAWQNTLEPPPAPIVRDPERAAQGRQVFEKAMCSMCHAGPALTSNKVIAAPEIATEPARAMALQKTEAVFGPPLTWTFDTPVPVPDGAEAMLVNMRGLDPHQLDLAWAHGGTLGGYKVPSLLGLFWSAPYLHDGGVAMGRGGEAGVASTVMGGTPADPGQSLLALVDRKLRDEVVSANDANRSLKAVRVRGVGHDIWVDTQSGFTVDEQMALVHYLLTLQRRSDEDPANFPDDTQVSLVGQ